VIDLFFCGEDHWSESFRKVKFSGNPALTRAAKDSTHHEQGLYTPII